MILAIQTRYAHAVYCYQTSLAHIDVLRTDDEHGQQRRARISSLSAPPPTGSDFDLDRLEAEVRVALVEALTGAGDVPGARYAIERARPLTRGLLRRRLRRRLERVEESLPAAPGSPVDPAALRRSLSRAATPAQERGLRLRLANAYLDSGDFDSAVREALLLIRDSDAVGDHAVRAGARQVLGLGLEGQGRPDEGVSVLSEAFKDLRDHGDQAGLIGMGEALAQRLMVRGDAAAATSVLRTTERAAADSGNRIAELSSATMLGVVLDETGDRKGAVRILDNVVSRAQTYQLPLARADALHSAAVALGRSARPDDLVESLSLLDEAKRLYAELEKPERIAGCEHEAAALLGRNRSYDAAAARYRAALQAYRLLPAELRDTGDWPDELADVEGNLAWLNGERGDPGPQLFHSGGHSMSHSG